MTVDGIPAALGALADRFVGEPPDRFHPVAWFGTVMGAAERRWYHDDRRRGVLHAAAGVALGAGTGLVLRRLLGRRLATAVATEVAIAGTTLAASAERIAAALTAGDLDGARALLPMLVGRDPTGLDEGEVARAVVESVAENTVDAIVAPLVYAVVGGAPAVLAHRAVNTLDAMVGHHDPRYEHFGWASARLDDVAAWLPARLTAVAVALARPARAGAVWRAVREDAPSHPSPNAGVAEAAFAAALGLRLGGRNRYGHRSEDRPTLGDGRAPSAADVAAAVRLSRDVTVMVAVSGAALQVAASVNRRGC